jgi:hypothetical protein
LVTLAILVPDQPVRWHCRLSEMEIAETNAAMATTTSEALPPVRGFSEEMKGAPRTGAASPDR